ncbi:MAG TPA: hypothetical protein VJK06_00485, partial [Methyloceanibacter sp.]|nr:hypothetical protein [Methyloceanibacter sp.]
SRTATKKPSVPWLLGVINKVSDEPSAEVGASGPMADCQSSGHGTILKSGWRARKASICETMQTDYDKLVQ